MRIISGLLKGRSINFLKNTFTRPLKDSVKENIFNILNHSNFIKVKIKNSNVLDLYSGIGSFGIECISRGSKKVCFIEKDRITTNILKENLINLSIVDKSKIYIDKTDNVISKNLNSKFDIFFLDPPFADLDYLQNLMLIKKKRIFKKDHIVIIHREENSKDEFDNILKIVENKKYGRSKILFGVFS
tara:strand:- start:30 stop:590 length:561 start_codon:yes stop_codon:yes gene_type:complete